MAVIAESDRLVIREWTEADGDAALAIYGSSEVARWLSPAMGQVPNKRPCVCCCVHGSRPAGMSYRRRGDGR
jgi:hypothetical protein